MSSSQIFDDGYFNDLARQPSQNISDGQNGSNNNDHAANNESCEIPKPKRVACAICRKRKLKCDGNRPKCGTCARLGHHCAYDEVRRKSGPKRGYVKELEARLAQVETQLKSKANDNDPQISQAQDQIPEPPALNSTLSSLSDDGNQMQGLGLSRAVPDLYNPLSQPTETFVDPNIMPDLDFTTSFDDAATWEMIGLGLEEPLPTQEAIDELHDIYFNKFHPSAPMIHQYRYRAAMGLAPHMRPPVSLRYAMWCLAANVSEKYSNHKDIFYRRARRYADTDEMKGLGEAFVTVAHCQAWILIATYEFQMMYFPRAWASVGRTVRLAQMMGLNRLDGKGLDVKQVLPPSRDWTEKEERRRTFWMGYCIDRYASMGTGWPLAVDERDIRSNLPANEENFEKSIQQDTLPLSEKISPEGASKLSPFAGIVYMAYIFGRNLTHLHRPDSDDEDKDLEGEFWKRHRQLDNLLLHTAMSLPSHLRLPNGVRDPNIVFINMSLHTSTICLHQAAIFKAEQKTLPPSLMDQSSTRCVLAATEIANIMRLISHLDCMGMNPFLAFCLYVAARVFVHLLKKTPNETTIRSSLEFLLEAMQHFKKTNPLSESFLIQLGLDLQGTDLDFLLQNPSHSSTSLSSIAKYQAASQYASKIDCVPIAHINDKNKHMHPMDEVPQLFKTPLQDPQLVDREQPYPRPSQYSMQNFAYRSKDPRPESLRSPLSHDPSPPELGILNGSMPDGLDSVPARLVRQYGDRSYLNGSTEIYDTDVSTEQNSSGPTPENSSSNTSYSPHSQNGELGATMSKSTTHQSSNATARLSEIFNYGDSSFVSPAVKQIYGKDANVDLTTPWNMDPAAASPSNVPTGLTPGVDGSWSQMLDNMNWDSTAFDPTMAQWGASPGSTRG
ncbi:MAG: hypothetical protein Q9220_001231 [cf. Caloplaca sp. 1 TL-2023]